MMSDSDEACNRLRLCMCMFMIGGRGHRGEGMEEEYWWTLNEAIFAYECLGFS